MSARNVALLVVALAYLLRVHNLNFQSFWRDEIDAALLAQSSLSDLARMYGQVGENGPLYLTLLHVWIGLVGNSDFAVRYSSVLAGVLTVPLVFRLGTRLSSHWVGVSAAVLLAGAPYHLWYSQEAKMYALVVLVASLSFWLLLVALRSARWTPWIAWLAILVAGLYVHFFLALLAVSEAILVAAAWRLDYGGARRGIKLVLVLGIGYVPLAIWQLPLLVNGYTTDYPVYPVDVMLGILFAKFSLGLQQTTIPGMAIFLFLLVAGIVLTNLEEVGWARWLSLAWLIVPIGLFLVLSLRVHLFLDRYFIFVLPAYLLILARGLDAVRQRSALVSVVVALFVAGTWLPQDWSAVSLKQDFRHAVAYLNTHVKPDDSVIFLPSWEQVYFDYYDSKPFHLLLVPPVDVEGLDPAATQVTATLGRPGSGMWLLSVEPAYVDRQHQLQDWLDRHATRLDEVNLPGMELRYYRGPGR